MAQPLVAPLFLQTDQIDSNITVVNALLQSSGGTLTLRDLDGHVAAKKHITFASHSSTVVVLHQVLAEAGSFVRAGSVTLMQDPQIKGPALLAQLSMTMHTGSQSVFLEVEFGMPSPMGSAKLQGVASETVNAPLIAISSTSDAPQHIRSSCVGDPTISAGASFELASGATAVIRACSWEQLRDPDLNIVGTLANNTHSGKHSVGVSITSDSVPGAFYAFGFALNGSSMRAQLQPLDFYDPKMLASTRTVYAGVPVGPNEAIQQGTYLPVVTLVNFSKYPRNTKIEFANSSSGGPQVQPIEQVLLPPLSSQTFEFNNLAGSGLQNSFLLTSDGIPGDVQAHLFAYKKATDQRVEMLAKDSKDDHNGGDHPWSVDEGNLSTLLLFNSTNSKQEFQVRISGKGFSWIDLFRLLPFETKAISINDLVRRKTPDHDRHTIPSDASTGEVQWSTQFPSSGVGRLLVSNRETGLSRSFSCETYTNLCGVRFGPESFEDLFLGGDSLSFYSIQPIFCTEYSPYQCSQSAPTGAGYSYSTSWQGVNSSHTQMTSSSNSQVSLKGIGTGSFSFTGYVQSGSCSAGGSGGGVVQVPTDSRITQTVASHAASCPINQAGWYRQVYKIVTDQAGADMVIAGQYLTETLTVNSPAPLGGAGNITEGSGSTNANGIFTDTYQICSPACPSVASNSVTQNITDSQNGRAYTLRPVSLVYACTNITANGK